MPSGRTLRVSSVYPHHELTSNSYADDNLSPAGLHICMIHSALNLFMKQILIFCANLLISSKLKPWENS